MKENTALLIIDLQQGFNPTEKMIDNFLHKSKDYQTIVATQFINGNKLFQRVLKHPIFSSQELVFADLPKKVKVFKKTGYGLPHSLIRYLKNKKITHVDIGGLETDACVLAAMFNLWDAGIQPRLLKNLTTTRNVKLKKSALLISKRNFGS